MNKFHKNVNYLISILVSLLVFVTAQAEQKIPAKTKAPTEIINLSPLVMDDPTLHPDYNLYLLSHGRNVYEQLKIARQASLDNNMATLKASLDLAQESLEKLQIPSIVKDLDKQQAVIQRDLKGIDANLGDALWVPVDATLSTSIILDSDITAGNEKKPTKKIDDDEGLEVSDYRLGIFPLNRTKQDISLTVQSVEASKPSWEEITKTVKTTFDDVKWFFKVPTHGLVSAYTHTMNSYTLTNNATISSAQNQLIIKELKAAKSELKKSSNTQALQDETQDLIDKKKPTANDLNNLVGIYQEKLRYVHDQSAKKFMDEIATEAISPD